MQKKSKKKKVREGFLNSKISLKSIKITSCHALNVNNHYKVSFLKPVRNFRIFIKSRILASSDVWE